MFYIKNVDGVDELFQVSAKSEAPAGAMAFEVAEEAWADWDKTQDSAGPIDEIDAALKQAGIELVDHDSNSGIIQQADSSLLIRACAYTLLLRGDMLTQLERAGLADEANAVRQFLEQNG